MKLSLVPLAVVAGAGITQVSAAPYNLVSIKPSYNQAPPSPFRLGHAAGLAISGDAMTPELNQESKIPTLLTWGVRTKPCGGRNRGGIQVLTNSRIVELSNKLRAALGIPLITVVGDSGMHPPIQFENTADVPPVMVYHFRTVGGVSRLSDDQMEFIQRLQRGIEQLGPWEASAVSFVIGSGIGVVLRLVFLFCLMFVRGVKGCFTKSRTDPEAMVGEETHALLLDLPAYSDEKSGELIVIKEMEIIPTAGN